MANRPFEGVLKRQWRTFGNETQNAAQTSDKSNSGESSGDSKRTTPQDTKSKSVISKSSDRADLRNMSSYFLSNAERKKNGNVFVPSTVMGKKSGTDNIVRFTPQKKNNIGIGLENPLFPSDLFKNEEIKITSTATKDNKPISDDLDKKLQKLYEEYRAINDAWKNNSMSAYDYNARIAGLKTNNKSVFDAYKKETGGELQIPHLGEMYKNARSTAQQNKKDNEYYRKLKTYYDSYYANDFQKYISDSATSSAENKLDKKLNNIVDASDAYITNIESNSDAPHMYFNSQTNMYEPKVLRNPNSPDMKYLYMTEPERSIYKYQLNKYGEKAADDFLKRMDLILDKRLTEANNKYTEKLTEEHPVLMATGNILTAPVRGAAALADATAQAGKQTFGKEYVPYNPYTNATKLVHQADTVKRTITKDMSPVAKFFTETGMGVGENVSRMAFGNLALPIMGMNVAGETAVDKGVKGETNATKAFATGAAYGGIEMLTEKIPLDNIFKVLKAPPSTIKEAAVTLLKNAGVEASEEAISNIADNVADNIINKDKSEYEQYKQILREQGYSNEEAEKNAFIKFYITDTGISALQGGLSGGILNAGSMATGAAVNNYNDTVQTGRGFRTMGADVVESVINTGKESDNNTPAYKYAQKMQEKQNKGADLSDWNVGRQYQKNVKAVQSENDFAAAMSNIKPTEITAELYNDRGQELNGVSTASSVKASANGSQSVPMTIKHEWSHMFKNLDPTAYSEYEASVIKAAREANDEAVNKRMDFLMNEYGYSEEVAREEIVAELTGGFNTKAIQRMAEGNKTLAAAIADATRTAKAKLRTAFTDGKYTSTTGLQMTFSQLNQAEKMYVYGLNKARNNQVQSEQVRYSPIEYDSDGKAYVKIDEDILEGVPKNEWAKTVRNVLREKFSNGIDYNGENVAVSRKSRNEFTESKYTKNLFENTKSNKFRMANNLDEIINIQNDIDIENPNHIRKDDIVGFERGNTRVAIGDNEFTAEVLIANKKDGTKQFYDIINLQPTKIQQLSQSGRINDVNTEDADSAVSNNSIPKNDKNVKYSVKENTDKVSKLYENTMQKDAFGDEFKSEAERRKPEFMYEGITNKETYAAAQSDIARRGDSEVLSELSMKNSGWTAEDTAKSLALMAQYQSEGNAEKAVDVASMLREKMTRAGQAVQALKIVNKLTPEGQFIDFTRQADKLVDEQIEKHPASEKIRKEIKEAQKRDKIKMGAELHSDNLLTHVTDMAENSKGKSTPKAEPSEWELENSKNTVNASGSTNTVSQGVRKVKMDRKAIRYLKDKDIEEYRLTGNQHTKDKKADIIKKGESIILRSKNETDDFINVSVANENIHQTKAFSKVTDRMVNDVQTVGNIDVSNYYLELNSSDIRHTFEHLNETRKNQIALTEEDIKRIPEYIVNYDDILEVNSKKDGRKIVVLGKKINGHSVIINVASKGRRALTFKSAYVLNTQKYNELYGKSKKDTATRGATATNNVTMPDTSKHAPTAVSSNNSILNYNENVKTEYEKVLDKYGIEYLSPSDMRDTADRLGQLDRLQSKDDLIDLILEQSKERKTASHAIVKKALEGQEITFLKDTAMMQIFGKISDKMPVTFAQKASTYQAMSHLLNARTMARNIVSNTVFNTADMVSTDLGSIADCIMGMFSGQRTVGADRGVFEKGRFRASLDRATKQYIDIALAVDHESGGSKYNLDSARRTFKGRTGGLERAMSYGLQVTDEWSKGGIEHNVRKSLERLKKSGFTEEEINSIAKYEARYRTFQDDTKLSQVLKGLKDTLNVIGIGETKQLGRLKSHEFGLGDLVQKYTQVPGALITRSVEYSPLGYCKALYHIGQAANNARKGADFSAQAQRNIALSLGRAMTGTGLIALFAGLSRLGIFTGEREDEDEKLKAMENAEGVSNTQLNLSALGRLITDGEADGRQNGDVLTSLGFLEPLNTLMAMGNAIAEQGSVKNPVDWAKAAGAKTFDQIMDMSTMSTIRSISNTLQYGGGGTDVAIGVIADSATGFVPSPVRQLGGFLDTVQRNPYNEEDNLARAKERFKATLPWAREDVAAKINPYGEEKTTSSGNRALDFLNNFFSPGSVNIYQTSDISEELYRLAKTSTDVLPHVPAKSFTVDKVKFKPRGKDYEKYSRLVGTITAQKMRDIINGDDYSGMSDEEKIDALSTAATEGEKEAKEQYAAGKADDMPAPHFRMTEPAALKKKQEEINEKNERQEKITGQLQAVSDAAAAAVPDKADNYSLKSLQINSIQSVKIDGKSYDISGEIESKIISAANDEHYSNIEKLMNNEVNVEDIVGYTSKGKVSTAKQADGTKVSLTGKLYNEDGSPRFDELVIAKIISKSKEKSKEHAAEKYRGEITGSSAEGIQVSKSSVNGQGRSTRAKSSLGKSSSGSKGSSSGGRVRFTSARAAGGDRKSGSTASSGGTSRVVFTARANTGKSNPNYSVVGLPDLIQIPRLPMLDKNYGKLKGSVKTLDNPLFA